MFGYCVWPVFVFVPVIFKKKKKKKCTNELNRIKKKEKENKYEKKEKSFSDNIKKNQTFSKHDNGNKRERE